MANLSIYFFFFFFFFFLRSVDFMFVSCVVDESGVDNNSSCWGILGMMCAMIFGAWRLQGLHKVLTNNVKALSFERRGNYGRREGIGVYLSIYLSFFGECLQCLLC
jgi:uncharacterized membrane protein